MPRTKSKPVAAPPSERFVIDGDVRADGSIRYKILCDGGINPSGVFWQAVVPAGASNGEIRAVQAERDATLKELGAL